MRLASHEELSMDREEIFGVLRYERPLLASRPSQDLTVGQLPKRRVFGSGQDVVTFAPELAGDGGGEVLVEEKL